MRKILFLSAILFSFFACSKKTIPTTTTNTSPQYALMDTKATIGFNLAKSNCNSCHSFHQPYSYAKEKWDKVLPVMYKKAKMTDTTEQQQLAYFVYNNLNKPGADLPFSK